MPKMTPEQAKLVQDSFKQVLPIAPQAADMFYGRLFEIAPKLRSLFPSDLSEQKKKLMTMLATAVNGLHQPDTIIPAVKALGSRHAGYGVTAADYKPVGEALIWTLRGGLGEAFTPQVEAAWLATYTTLENVMTAAAAEPKPAKRGLLERLFG
jgi:hemoglobin-like flavoprotein